MNIEIKPLTVNLITSYLNFFDNQAFSDGNPCGPCYCTSPSMDAESEARMISEFGADIKGTLRNHAINLLIAGKIHGYLAFDGDTPVGWCNAGNRDLYPCWIPAFAKMPSDGKTMAVVCFTIAPNYRGMGIASAMLERVMHDARAGGFATVEGYPREHQNREPYDFNGPLRLFEKAGFLEKVRQGDVIVMSKALQRE